MFQARTVFLLLAVAVTFCNSKAVPNPSCRADDVEFATKIANSSFVVYGKPTAKALYNNSDAMFFGTFRVDCILKGTPVANVISIVRAGRVPGKTYCQELSVGGDSIIAFLERDVSKVNDSDVFIPADFADIIAEGNTTAELLANTCNLQRTLPIGSTGSLSNVCPVVSTNAQCVVTTSTSVGDSAFGTMVSGQFHNGTEHIRGKSGTIQVDVDTNHAVSHHRVNILLIVVAVLARLY